VDSIGSTSALVEVDQMAAVSDVLIQLGFADFVVRLNHRGVLYGLLNAAGVGSGHHADALVALDKLDKIGVEGVAREFNARGIAQSVAERCLEQFAVPATEKPEETVRRLERTLGGDDASVANLREIAALASTTTAGGRLRVDLNLARGLSYYTGAIMEIVVPDLAGSLGGGGRYDNLVGMFLGRDVPACGFSLGLERIIVVMTERALFPADVVGGTVDVMVTLWNEESRADALALGSELRRSGLRVDIYPEAEKLGKQFKYASTRNVPFVAVIGDDERAQGKVSIKDLRTGDQQTIERSEAGRHVATRRQS
jgi:histidyl-tRNA synthetase